MGSHLNSYVKQLLKIWVALAYGGIFRPTKFYILPVSHSWHFGDMSDDLSVAQHSKIIVIYSAHPAFASLNPFMSNPEQESRSAFQPILPEIQAVYLTFSETGYVASRCQYRQLSWGAS